MAVINGVDSTEDDLGTLVNTGGTATIGGILGDVANSSFATRVAALQTLVGTLTNTGAGADTLGGILGDPESVTFATDLKKISRADGGQMAATVGSLAYDIAETEQHFHSNERWFGLAGTPDAEVHRADRIGTTSTAFQIDAGNDTWGAWLQVLGSTDTPATAAMVQYDFHKLFIVAAESASTVHFIQIAYGTSGAAALTAGTYTEFVYRTGAAVSREAPIVIQARQHPAGTKAWARCWAVGKNTSTLDFFIGLHEYPG